MADIKRFKVGDPVIITDVNGKGRLHHTHVVKIGRTNVTVEEGFWHEPNKAFNAETGFEAGGSKYNHQHLYTVPEWEARQERKELVDRYRAAGLDETYRAPFREITNDQLRRILAIVEEEN